MNRKINKITTWLAAAIFLLTLAINVKVTLTDPFLFMSDAAIATGTDGGTGGGTGDCCPDVWNWMKLQWVKDEDCIRRKESIMVYCETNKIYRTYFDAYGKIAGKAI